VTRAAALLHRRPQVAVLGSAEPGSRAHALAGEAGALLARLGLTLVSGCGSPATRVAAERAVRAGGEVLSIVPPDVMPDDDWPATVVLPCGMGDARNLLMALAGDACLVIGGRAGTISEVCLAWLHRRPLLPLVGCGGWSDTLPDQPPDERGLAPILPWNSVAALEQQLHGLGLVPGDVVPAAGADPDEAALPGDDQISLQAFDDPPAADVLAVDEGLEGYSQSVAPLGEVRSMAVFARDAAGALRGGAVGRTWGLCCELQQLWVDASSRGQGLGSRLLRAFEVHGRQRGCQVFYLTTLSYQAPDFYRRHGYHVLSELSGYPQGITKLLMHKLLA
jgi:uncharacterized protein (TIGR00725 family)